MTSKSLIQLPQVRRAEFSGYVVEIITPLLLLATGSGLATQGSDGRFQLKSGVSLHESSLGEYSGKIGYGTSVPVYDFHISGKNLGVNGTGYFDALYIADSHVATEYVLGVTGQHLNNLISVQSGYSSSTYYPRSNPSGYITGLEGAEILPFVLNKYSLPSGNASTGFIPFNYTFPSIPIVVGNLVNTGNDSLVGYYISEINTSGFYISFSDDLASNNYSFHYQATTGVGYFALGASAGYVNLSSRIITDNYTISLADNVIIFNRSSAITGTLPKALGAGKAYTIKNINSGIGVINGFGADMIDDELSQQVRQWESIHIVDYAVNRWIIV